MACCVHERVSRVSTSWADDESFIQDDASLPASLVGSCGGGDTTDDASAEDALEALIQAELSKFQQQQAAWYAELLACGQATVVPLASPAPQQQLLRAHEHKQLKQSLQQEEEAPLPLSDDARVEYLPSAEASKLAPAPSNTACTAEASSCALVLSASSSQHALQGQPEGAVAGTATSSGVQASAGGLTAATVQVDGAEGLVRPEGSSVAEAAACDPSSASSLEACPGGEQDPAGSSEDPESFIQDDNDAADTPRFCSSTGGGSGRGSSSSAEVAGGSSSPPPAATGAGFSASAAGSSAARGAAAAAAAARRDRLQEEELGPWTTAEDAVLSVSAGGARNGGSSSSSSSSSSGGARAARPLSAHGPRAGRSCAAGQQQDGATNSQQQQQQPRCQQAQHLGPTRPSSAPAQTHLRSWPAGRGAPQQQQLGVVSESSQEGLSLLRRSDGSSTSRSQAQPKQPPTWSGRPASAAPGPAMPSLAPGCRQPKWDDSPLPLRIPKWVPMAEAVQAQADSPAAAAVTRGGGMTVAAGSSGRWDALGSSVSNSRRRAASAADSPVSSRPQTAGPRMQHQQHRGALHQSSAWGPAAALMPSRPGSGSSSSHTNMEPRCWYCGGRAASGSCSCRGPGQSRPATAGPGLRGLRGAGATSNSAEGAGDVSAYLLDVLQQVRQANACCKQLGLLKQFRLAAATAARPSSSSRRPEPQPSQVVELWELGSSGSSSTAEGTRSPERGAQHSTPQAGGPADASWHLRRRLTLQQFTQHLARLRACAATAAAAALSTGAARASSRYPVRPASTGRRGQSPTRPQQHGASSSRRGGSARAAAAAGSQMLLVLSPRGPGGSSRGCVLRSVMSPPASRPASAPRACSRLSPRRERACEP